MRFNSCPLFVAQPQQISAHQSSPNTNQYRIVEPERLMSSDPNQQHTVQLRLRLPTKRKISPGTFYHGKKKYDRKTQTEHHGKCGQISSPRKQNGVLESYSRHLD
jgi:hypothetical protein